MTLAELERAIESKRREQLRKAQEAASRDYILADLIGRSIGRYYSSKNTLPEISAVYPNLFDNTEIEQKRAEKTVELSVIRLKMFADTHNRKFKEASTNE